jgi:hypothetical protein
MLFAGLNIKDGRKRRGGGEDEESTLQNVAVKFLLVKVCLIITVFFKSP